MGTKRGTKQNKYSPEFKLSVILDMRNNHLGYNETARKYWPNDKSGTNHKNVVKRWERIYLEEGEIGLSIEQRGRTTKMSNSNKGRPRKKPLSPDIEEDLIAENQRLREENQYMRMEIDYIKKLSALVLAEEQKNGKKQK